MKSYLIGYDLNRPIQNYAGLIDRLKRYPNWWHHLDSTWVVKTNDSAAQIRNTLMPLIDSNDELLVAGLTGEGAWIGFNTSGSTWLKAHL